LFPLAVFSQGFSGKIIDKTTQNPIPNTYLSVFSSESLTKTDNFPKGGRYDERFWGMSNYLIQTPAMLKITEKN
jgi:hypothetical protein